MSDYHQLLYPPGQAPKMRLRASASESGESFEFTLNNQRDINGYVTQTRWRATRIHLQPGQVRRMRGMLCPEGEWQRFINEPDFRRSYWNGYQVPGWSSLHDVRLGAPGTYQMRRVPQERTVWESYTAEVLADFEQVLEAPQTPDIDLAASGEWFATFQTGGRRWRVRRVVERDFQPNGEWTGRGWWCDASNARALANGDPLSVTRAGLDEASGHAPGWNDTVYAISMSWSPSNNSWLLTFEEAA